MNKNVAGGHNVLY